MVDNHVHIGWFSDGYHSPFDVWRAVRKAGISEIAVSSTSTCAEKYKLVVREMRELIRLGGQKIHPVLWLTPRMMRTWGLRYMLHSKVQWHGVKMHWFAHREWQCNRKITQQAIDIARRLKVPMLVHTGDDKCCEASIFEPLCLENPDVIFILAHGRPLIQTMQVLSHCANTLVDTAFMPIEDVLTLADKGFANRIIFGSDAPINQLYCNGLSTIQYIKRQIDELKEQLTIGDFEAIMHRCAYN
ncbi:MAG: amidohydrolase family protein [Sodaliphilus sp.]|uniref:amidohydrolase family protein n=1 Tax=Sodaliphilus pleomorphus TaxID=2606626 RepID=UPI0023F4F293|nr:amidohydrolase family protein [Sodaliphilus pleomorphus]MDD7066260.1 amidohydrolase family protein [Sodaliphilus pleomorphus]MDY4406222.1 amidohydrolase family protein [Sodaliphilus sp.]